MLYSQPRGVPEYVFTSTWLMYKKWLDVFFFKAAVASSLPPSPIPSRLIVCLVSFVFGGAQCTAAAESIERSMKRQPDLFTLFVDPVTDDIAPNYSEVRRDTGTSPNTPVVSCETFPRGWVGVAGWRVVFVCVGEGVFLLIGT